MSFGSLLIESSRAMRTSYIVRILATRGRREVRERDAGLLHCGEFLRILYCILKLIMFRFPRIIVRFFLRCCSTTSGRVFLRFKCLFLLYFRFAFRITHLLFLADRLVFPQSIHCEISPTQTARSQGHIGGRRRVGTRRNRVRFGRNGRNGGAR